MVNLFNIQESVQGVAEAISAVLDVDVTIVDSSLTRVAATGKYKRLICKKLPKNCSFEIISRKKEPDFVDKPNVSNKCVNCSLKGSCDELATIGYPILHEGELLGIIGLIAFNEEQRNRIYDDYKSLIVFLSKLGELLAGNLQYTNTIKELTIQGQEIKMIVDGLENGIICIDDEGRIKFTNSKIEKLLKVKGSKLINKSIYSIMPEIKTYENSNVPVETKIDVEGKRKSFIVKTIPVTLENKRVSSIMEINETSNMVANAYRLIEGTSNISFDHIIGDSPNIVEVKDIARKVASSKSTVLLTGESGTGKELFARAIHYASNRSHLPFVAINCASIPDNLLESELFGYEGGAFTGANRQGQMGKLELANGGTLFLDEIGDLPLHLQPKLLRVLQDGQFMRLGGKEFISVDFRLIAATNRDLKEMIKNGEFREDLYYRLNVIPIHIPPLRERIEDIDKLSEYLLNKYCYKLGVKRKRFSKDVKEAFYEYQWPGNVRELENVVEYLVNIVKEEEIKLENLPNNMKDYIDKSNRMGNTCKLKDMMDSYERDILVSYLKAYGSGTEDKKKIAHLLGINLSTLYRKLSKYNLQ